MRRVLVPVLAVTVSLLIANPAWADLSSDLDEVSGQIDELEAAIEAAGAALGSPGEPDAPANRSAAGLTNDPTDTVGRYFDSVAVSYGVIIVTYDTSETNAAIRSRTMTWTPYESLDGTIVWRCGAAPRPDNTEPMGWAGQTSVAAYTAPTMPLEYLPAGCRP